MARESFLAQLPVELDEWQRRGLIGAGQARRILALYGLTVPVAGEARRQGRLAALAGVLGAVLTGVGVILFVASNWQRMDRPLKVVLLLGMLLAAYGVGYWLKLGRAERPGVGEGFIFLGSIIFGANIFLIAQIYHVRVGEPLLLAAWSAGAFATAYAA